MIGSGLSSLPDKVFLPSTGSRIVGGDNLLPARMGRVIRTADRVSGGLGEGHPVCGQYASVQGVAADVIGELGTHADTQQPHSDRLTSCGAGSYGISHRSLSVR